MALSGRFKRPPLDKWAIREKLALACSVLRSGDQNWVSVARQIKPFAECDRPAEWFSQKNCALQYSELLETVETPNRMKRGERKSLGATETPQLQIARKLTLERVDELRDIIKQEQALYSNMRDEVDRIQVGDLDDQLEQMWADIQKKEALKNDKNSDSSSSSSPTPTASTSKQPVPSLAGGDGDTAVSAAALTSNNKANSNSSHNSTSSTAATQSEASVSSSQNQMKSEASSSSQTGAGSSGDATLRGASGDGNEQNSDQSALQHIQEVKIKIEAEDTSVDTHISVTEDDVNVIQEVEVKEEVVIDSSHDQELSLTTEGDSTTFITATDDESTRENTPASELLQQHLIEEVVEVEEVITDMTDLHTSTPVPEQSQTSGLESDTLKQEVEVKEIKEEPMSVESKQATNARQESHESVSQILDDSSQIPPLSPSSVTSHDTDVTIPSSVTPVPPITSSGRRGRTKNRGSARRGRRSHAAKKEQEELAKSIIASEADSSEDEKCSNASTKRSMSFLGSLPSSPAGSTQGDNSADREHKNWKKSIMLVWRAAANHKYAKVFQQPVTEAIAPGYKNIVLRPMDLQTIKKNIETDKITTTTEFQRDIMLMFTNAIMYNSSDHNVHHMAQEMYDDVLQHIEQYISTQMMMTDAGTPTIKLLRQSRRTDGLSGSEKSDIDKEEEVKKTGQRGSTEASDGTPGGMGKKRKT